MGNRKFFVFLRYLIVLVLTFFIVATALHFSSREETEKGITRLPVIVSLPQKATLEENISLSGHIQTDHLVAVVPFSSGTLQSWNISLGDRVEQNQVLATIDPEPYRQQVLQAQAAKEVAQTTFERMRSLHTARVITDQIFEEAKAQQEATLAQWELAQRQLDQTNIKAPITGTVIQSLGSVGNIASPEKPVAILADMQSLTVTVHVPQVFYDIITENRSTIEIQVSRTHTDGSLVQATAKIESIGAVVDPASNTFTMTCKLMEGYQNFIPGMHVRLRIIYHQHHDAYTLKQQMRTIDGAFYFYDEENGVARYQKVPVIAENDSLVAIDPAYKDTLFIIDGHHTVLDGQPVIVTNQR